jgi:hypothetical protein
MKRAAKRALDNLKRNIREMECSFFTDEELIHLLEKNEFDLRRASYEALILKAENDGIRLPSGLAVSGSREYWLGLARMYRTGAGGALKRKEG